MRTRPRSVRRYLRRLYAEDGSRFARAVGGPQRLSALRAVVDGPVVLARLRRHGLRSLIDRLPDRAPSAYDEAVAVSSAVDAGLAVLPMAFTCLRRSVVLLRELDRRDLGAALQIGVRRGDAGIEAHAWVQVGERVVNDDPDVVRTYTPLPVEAALAREVVFR